MSRQATVARIEELCGRAGLAEGVEVVEVELKGTGRNQLLRIYIDKTGGVTHGDCELVSQKVGDLIDAEDVLPEHYVLEVSSPGVERKLKKPADFERFQGQKVKVVMRESGPGEKKGRFVEGVLASTDSTGVLLEVSGGERVAIPFDAIDRANLKFEW